MIEWIKDHEHLTQVQDKHKEFLIVLFYAQFSSAAKRALAELEQFSKDNKQVAVYGIDVERVKGVHKQFAVENVPTVVALRKGKVAQRLEGVESAQFYARMLSGAHPSAYKTGKGGPASHRVIVYSGPGCPACGTAKAYLRRRGVHFREIDIARDQHAAQSLVRRSGQMAVPQIDIDGRLVVGFDQATIDRMLST
jgi:glutaredoxin-like YruB-family protein